MGHIKRNPKEVKRAEGCGGELCCSQLTTGMVCGCRVGPVTEHVERLARWGLFEGLDFPFLEGI